MTFEYADLIYVTPEMSNRLQPKMDGDRILSIFDLIQRRIPEWSVGSGPIAVHAHPTTEGQPHVSEVTTIDSLIMRLAIENFKIWIGTGSTDHDECLSQLNEARSGLGDIANKINLIQLQLYSASNFEGRVLNRMTAMQALFTAYRHLRCTVARLMEVPDAIIGLPRV